MFTSLPACLVYIIRWSHYIIESEWPTQLFFVLGAERVYWNTLSYFVLLNTVHVRWGSRIINNWEHKKQILHEYFAMHKQLQDKTKQKAV